MERLLFLSCFLVRYLGFVKYRKMTHMMMPIAQYSKYMLILQLDDSMAFVRQEGTNETKRKNLLDNN